MKRTATYCLLGITMGITPLVGHAKWYGDFPVTIGTGFSTLCTTDNVTDAIKPPFDGNNTPYRGEAANGTLDKGPDGKGYYVAQGRVSRYAAETNTFYCQHWDATIPKGVAIDYILENEEKAAIISMNALDGGGSGLKRYEIQYRQSDGTNNFSTWSEWKSAGSIDSQSHSERSIFLLPDTQGKINGFQFRFRVYDVAGNTPSNWFGNNKILQASADRRGWYGRHTEAFDNTKSEKGVKTPTGNATSFCDEDPHVDGNIKGNNVPSWVATRNDTRSPIFGGNSTPLMGDAWPNTWDAPNGNGYYYHQSRAISDLSGRMECEKWDGTKPWGLTVNYLNDNAKNNNGWTREPKIVIKIKAKDYGGSFSSPLALQMKGNAQLGIVGNKFVYQANTKTLSAVNVEMPTSGNIPYNIGVPSVIIEKKTSDIGPDFASGWSEWESINSFEEISIKTTNNSDLDATYMYTAPFTKGTAYKFRYKIVDGAGNESDWVEGQEVYKLDMELPNINNIGVQVSNPNDTSDDSAGNNSARIPKLNDDNNNFMAGDSSPIQIVYNNQDGSPIIVHYEIEEDDPANQMTPKQSTGFKYKFPLPNTYTEVDDDLNASLGGREVTLKLTKIVDAAGNETPIKNKTYTFNVFANIVQAITANTSESGTKIADGSENVYTREILDKYGNNIIPAKDIDRVISRTTTTSTNSMYLNQKTRTGDTSVYIKSDSASAADKLPRPGASIIKNSIIPQAGTSKYDLILQVYTPTANAYVDGGPVSDPKASFSLKSIISVKDDQKKIRSIASRDLASVNIDDPAYKPLFTSQITGDLRNGGFIEGAEQTSKVEVIKNSNSLKDIGLLSGKLSYEYNGEKADKFSLFLPYEDNFISNIFNKNTYEQKKYGSISTLLKQKDNETVDGTSKIYLSTHFVYSLDGKNITYNGDIIGKPSYHNNNNVSGSATQAGVKIIGTVADSKLNTILANQSGDLGNQVSESLDSSVRDEINKSIAIATRNIAMNPAGTTITNAASFPSGTGVNAGIVQHDNNSSILVIDAQGQTIKLTAQAISGKRTIVIRGGNLYIKNDMYYANNSILGVVIQKDSQGRGGNLYIDPGVTNIVGSYVMEGSVMSYDGTNEISVGNIDTLKNQLHIYGTIISHNTIGGSRTNPLKCPVFVTAANCDQNSAQKYDLNFLRRYYLWNNKPFGNAKVIGGGTVNNTGTVTGKKANLKQLFTNTDDDLAKYPLIIEYDANLLANPPIGFEAYRE